MFIKKNIQAVEQVLKPRVLKVDKKEFREARAWADRLRNGGKKFTHRIRRAINNS